ncbi:MAG TPA: BamA/TamA family outer membrane protein [Gemmatimonadales bacterium]|nr:BamA/TamA family outer membrane protein [Gemmatimonadales bacterium]
MRRIGGIAAALALCGAASLSAQYFGQNKVQYQAFDFHIIQTEHFEVYYYPAERAGALDAARMAERWYARLSRILHHQFQGRKPIILYASQSDFQQTNIVDASGEGLGGVTEFFKHRMVLPFTGAYADLEHVIGHEMVHQFQYDVYSRGRIGGGMQTLVNVNPPGWFMEGMAEYLSIGPIDPHTAMWLRDASLEGHLPTIQQLTQDERIFPYRFGHAIWAYVGEKWGDEAIGEILQASTMSGVEGAFKRALGLSLEDLSSEWRDAVQTTYLPQLADHYKARRIAQPVLTRKRSEGTLHLAPALTPDGREIAYFSEKNSFFVDLYLADAETGRVKRRLVGSTLNSNYESLRFVNSSGAFSPDGRSFAIAAKHKDRDDLVILDARSGHEVRRIRIPLNGVTTPAWSPSGKQLVFTGYDGGLSDLFLVNADGSDLRRLTNDKYADLEPSWSPDGKTIAFTTDRGGVTRFDALKFGNLRIALYHLETGAIELLRHMDQGKNINPVWAPDGRSLAFVSDRTGMSNVFLYDFGDQNIYQLTDVYTGVSGITSMSPCLSWAHEADRLAFAYYEDGEYNVYGLDNPRSLKRQPYQAPAQPPVTSLLAALRRPVGGGTALASATAAAPADAPSVPAPSGGTSVYRSPTGFRASGTPARTGADSSSTGTPVSVKQLLDSSPALPDTNEFTFKPYHTRFSPDYVARPTVGYERNNFGHGFFGGTAISLSDMLGNHTLAFAGSVNGRLAEAQVFAAYLNQSHRVNWLVGASQQPLYFYLPTGIKDSAHIYVITPQIERFVIRDVFAESYYPFSTFTRMELGAHFSSISQAVLSQPYWVDSASGQVFIPSDPQTQDFPSISYYGPQAALVHDNSLFGWVGPFAGTRWRLEVAPSWGTWRFTSGLVDWRRYFFARPFTFAFRGVFFGRYGRDADFFPQFVGSTELLRGYTANSFINNECLNSPTTSGTTGCAELDQLIGSKMAVANAELRFPLTRSVVLGFLPIGLPPIEGALFYDVGLAWNSNSTVVGRRSAGQSLETYRQPLRSWGASIRLNFLGFVILRADYTKPLDRTRNSAYWTLSLGPTF